MEITQKEIENLSEIERLEEACEKTLNLGKKILEENNSNKELIKAIAKQCLLRGMDIGYSARYDLKEQEIQLAKIGLELARSCYDSSDEIMKEYLYNAKITEKDPLVKSQLEQELKSLS